jgi:uncharacterized membrane protein
MTKANSKKHELKKVAEESSLSEIPPEVAKVLHEIPEDKRKTIMRFISFSISQHSGPLPDGETIKVYNEQIPNGGDRIMTTVEKQLEHRVKLETYGIRRTFNQSGTGQWMAFLIAIFFGFVAWDLGKDGKEWLAGVVAGVDIVGLVTVFILGRSKS